MRACSGDTSSFAGHNFDELSYCLARFGTSTQQCYVFLIDVRYLKCAYFISFFFQIGFDSSHHTACLGKTVCFANRGIYQRERLCLFQLNVHSVENGTYLLKCKDEVHSFVPAYLFAFGYTRANEYNPGVRMLCFGNTCSVVHGRSGSRHIRFQFRDVLFYQFDVRRAARSGHKSLAFFQFFQ